MSYEARTTTKAYPGADTQRTDFNDAAANATQSFLEVADDIPVATSIGTVTHEAAQSGQVYTWSITSGNDDGDFSISNAGTLHRVNGHTLDGGPYALVIRQTEGAPLFRFRDVEVEVTIAA